MSKFKGLIVEVMQEKVENKRRFHTKNTPASKNINTNAFSISIKKL